MSNVTPENKDENLFQLKTLVTFHSESGLSSQWSNIYQTALAGFDEEIDATLISKLR